MTETLLMSKVLSDKNDPCQKYPRFVFFYRLRFDDSKNSKHNHVLRPSGVYYHY